LDIIIWRAYQKNSQVDLAIKITKKPSMRNRTLCKQGDIGTIYEEKKKLKKEHALYESLYESSGDLTGCAARLDTDLHRTKTNTINPLKYLLS